MVSKNMDDELNFSRESLQFITKNNISIDEDFLKDSFNSIPEGGNFMSKELSQNFM